MNRLITISDDDVENVGEKLEPHERLALGDAIDSLSRGDHDEAAICETFRDEPRVVDAFRECLRRAQTR